MIKKILLLVFLNITIISIIIGEKYFDTKSNYLENKIKKYNSLIKELSKINAINKKLKNIPIYTYKNAENKTLNLIDYLIKNKFVINNYKNTSNTIISFLTLNNFKNNHLKNTIWSIYQINYPFIFFKTINMDRQTLKLQINIKAPYKVYNDKK